MAPSAVINILSSPSFDNEAASQQLLTEASSPVRQPAASTAVRGADLLNYARTLFKPAVPASSPQPESAGKLKRPGKLSRVSLNASGLVSETSQKKKNKRGAHMYDLEPSPQKKRPHSLPAQLASSDNEYAEVTPAVEEVEDRVSETSQAKPGDEGADGLKIVDGLHMVVGSVPKKKRGRLRKSDASAISTADPELVTPVFTAVEHDSTATDGNIPSSPPLPIKRQRGRPRKSGQSSISAQATTAERAPDQPGEAADVEPRPNQKTLFDETGPMSTSDGGSKVPPKKLRRLKKNGESHSRETELGRVAEAPSKTVKKAGKSFVDLGNPIDDTDEAVDDADAVVNETRKNAGVEYGKDRSTEITNSRNDEVDEDADQADDVEEGEELDDQAEQQEAEDQNEEAGAEGAPLATADSTKNSPNLSPFGIVFQFAGAEERDGECATKWGRILRRRCARARVILCRSGDDGPSLDDIAKLKDNLVGLLTSTNGKIGEHRRVHFKRDAFAYLFRELTLVLEAMHDKLQKMEGDITASSGALTIVYHFLDKMLVFKDTMDSWKVKVPQRSQGDRLIRDVESNLIVPLRDIAKEFRVLLQQLKRAEQGRQAMLEAQREYAAREQELIRQEEEFRSGRERRKRWQDLHIVRMQCEPDLARRRRLRFAELLQTQEIDANGRPFERIPFLGERSAPPSTWIAAVSDREWTTEQESALLDDLQSSIPLERIFTRHCRPRGALRDFSVSDFAAKMAWIRSGWAQLSQQHGWEIPEWVKKIPMLP